jgi:hypothetical protein
VVERALAGHEARDCREADVTAGDALMGGAIRGLGLFVRVEVLPTEVDETRARNVVNQITSYVSIPRDIDVNHLHGTFLRKIQVTKPKPTNRSSSPTPLLIYLKFARMHLRTESSTLSLPKMGRATRSPFALFVKRTIPLRDVGLK